MKRLLALLMSMTLVFALASCGNTETADNDQSDSAVSENAGDASSEESSEAEDNAPADDSEPAADDTPSANEDDAVGAPLAILNAVWGSYAEDEKFAVVGGDLSEENMNMEGPGKYSLADATVVDSSLGFPAASADKIDDAASLMHMLNGNTFTCGAYHVKNAEDIDAVVSEVKDNIMNRQWICGFPEKLVIATEDDCIIAFFGTEEMTGTFKDKLTAAYPAAQISVEENIM